MASLYHPRYPSRKRSPYYNLRCWLKGQRKHHYLLLRYPDGRRVVDRRDALRLKAEHELACQPSNQPAEIQTVTQGMAAYLEATHAQRRPSEQAKLTQRARRLTGLVLASGESFGHLPLAVLTNDHIQQVLNRLLQEPAKGHGHRLSRAISPVTRDHYLRFLRQCCRWWWHFKGWIAREVCQGIPLIGRSPSAAFVPEGQWDAFLALSRGHAYADGTAVALMTGLRGKSELSRMVAQDFWISKRIIRVRAELAKNGKEAYLPMMDELVPILEGALAHHAPESVVFPYDYWRWEKQVSRWLSALGYRGRLGLHTLRHSFCTWAYTRFGEYKGMELARHSSLEMARRYTHLRRMPVSPAEMTRQSGTLIGDTVEVSATRNGP